MSNPHATLPPRLGRALLARGERLGLAESCTGGALSDALTNVPGSSGWFRGGIVCYDTRVKIRLLGVDPALVAAEGVVSEAVALAMAEGACRALETEWGLALTGHAGEGPEQGLVWIALVGPAGREAFACRFGPLSRRAIKRLALEAALERLACRLEAPPGTSMV